MLLQAEIRATGREETAQIGRQVRVFRALRHSFKLRINTIIFLVFQVQLH